MKVVLDTNVLISGIFFTGPTYEILKAWRDGFIQITLSAEIIEEYQKVAKRLVEQFPSVNPTSILNLITANAEIVQVKELPTQVCEDPDDDKFLACALASKSTVIISGDKHLLRISGYQGITVLNPRNFVEKYLSASK